MEWGTVNFIKGSEGEKSSYTNIWSVESKFGRWSDSDISPRRRTCEVSHLCDE